MKSVMSIVRRVFNNKEKLKVGGVFDFTQIRDGKVIDEWESLNIVPNEGLNYILGVSLKGVAQKANWYLGVFDGVYTPIATDTGANIAGNSGESSAYAEAPVRPTWVGDAVSGQSVTNSTQAVFTINATVTMQGAFLISTNAVDDIAGLLYAASEFTSPRVLVSGDILQVGYTVSATST